MGREHKPECECEDCCEWLSESAYDSFMAGAITMKQAKAQSKRRRGGA